MFKSHNFVECIGLPVAEPKSAKETSLHTIHSALRAGSYAGGFLSVS
jgi:hypothetical protein